eukprot:6554695-Ditylum_brightwellii.AAC.1
MEGISSSKDTNKDIKEEAMKEEEVDKVVVVAVDVVVVEEEKETPTPPSTAGHTEAVPIGIMVANTRHKGTVLKQYSKTGWEVTTGIVIAEKGKQKMISMNRVITI